MKKFRCQQCGKCCQGGISVPIVYSDIARWNEEGRKDILREISWIANYPRKGEAGFYIAKKTFNSPQSCPFLAKEKNKHICSIHATKPMICRDYPAGKRRFDFCPGVKGVAGNKWIRELIGKKQTKDFRMALEDQGNLFKLIVEARTE